VKVRKPTTHLVDIGPLDAALRLPTAARIRTGQKTTCNRCGKAITDETFIGGFRTGKRTYLFHERCLDEQAAGLLSTERSITCG